MNDAGAPVIVPLTAELVPAVVSFYRALADDVTTATQDVYFTTRDNNASGPEAYIRSCIGNDDMIILVALVDSLPAGFIVAQINDCFLPLSAIKHIGYIATAYIAPPFRRMGIMRRLEERAITFFRGRGLSYSEINFMSRNEPARSCWNALGYNTFREQARKPL